MKHSLFFIILNLALLFSVFAKAEDDSQGTKTKEQPQLLKVEEQASISQTEEPSQEDYLVIADIAAFKGKTSVYGEQMRQGIRFGVKAVNEAGGIKGKKIKLLSYDDGCDPTESEKMANIIVASDGKNSKEKVLMAIGHTCIASTQIAMPIYAKADMLHFVPSYIDNLEDLDSKKIFVMGANIERRAGTASSFLKNTYPDDNIAVIYDDNTSSEKIANFVNDDFNKNINKPVYFASFLSGKTDYTALINELSQKNINVVYLATSLFDAQNILNQMKGKNFKAVYLSSNPLFNDGSFNPDFDGRIFFSFMPDARKIPEASFAVSRFRVSGIEPEGLTLYALAALEAFTKAYSLSKIKNIKDIANILKNKEFETCVGKIGFNISGEITGVMPSVYEWKNNNYTEVAENF
ncbi:MAG: branched-chain amino acid ABC transporter substrate-binding protein [Alphaproteobacteria bacterium]